jgi:glycosyltransferase involved in cell wall biosynthesis
MKFNIITTAYNSEETILNCYASIERQNFKDIKWIIIDGKSKEDNHNIFKNQNYSIQPNFMPFIFEPHNYL